MKAPRPPHYRPQDEADEKCGNCRMYDKGRCWGYGNVSVEKNYVCDSWASQGGSDTTKALWAAHRRRLERNR